MVAIFHQRDCTLAGAASLEFFRRIKIARLLVAAQVKDRTGDLRCELEDVGALGQHVEEALGARHVPPGGGEHELLSPALLPKTLPFLRHFFKPTPCTHTS